MDCQSTDIVVLFSMCVGKNLNEQHTTKHNETFDLFQLINDQNIMFPNVQDVLD